MEILSITDQSASAGVVDTVSRDANVANKMEGNIVETNKVKKGQVIQRNYVLSDTGALKKKMRHESRNEPFNLGVEARDGSNMVIEMKHHFSNRLRQTL